MSDEPDDDEDPTEPLETEQPTVDAGNPAAVKRRRTKQQLEQIESDAFWKAVFSDRVGRREMWRFLVPMHPFETPFACGPNGFPQPEATWFKAGESALGLRIYQTWLAKYPLEVMEMQREHDPRFAKRGK